jgi:hypothetical protein
MDSASQEFDTARTWPSEDLSRGPASKTEGAAWSTKDPAGSCLAVGFRIKF